MPPTRTVVFGLWIAGLAQDVLTPRVTKWLGISEIVLLAVSAAVILAKALGVA